MSGLQSDPLFVGLTRPALIFGVSYPFAVLNGLICLIVYIITTNFKYLVLMFPIHFAGYLLTSREPLFIELFKVRAEKCNRSRNRLYHGANTYDPY